MRLLLTRPLTQDVMDRAAARYDTVVRPSERYTDAAERAAALRDFDIVLATLGDVFSADLFARVPAPRCRLLANFGVGYNHIDVAAAESAGVSVSNTPGAVTDATADIAMTLLLMSARRAGEGERLVRAGGWAGWHPVQMLGTHVTGKSVGIVGMGRIGQAVARRCHFGFGMKVHYVSRTEKRLDYPAQRHESASALARQVDFVVLAVPGGAETRHMVNAEVLSQMGPHAHLVNISRGDVIDEAALVETLLARRIAGAGLDVYEFEPEVPEALRGLDNVTLLPHLGTAAEEVRSAMGHMALDNIDAFTEGRAMPNAVVQTSF